MKKLILLIFLLHICIFSAENIFHVVEQGETLYKISKEYNISIDTLKEINGLKSDNIFPGDMLKLEEEQKNQHTVQKGETLWEISSKYKIKIEELKHINNLKEDIIYEGQKLKISKKTSKEEIIETYTEYIVSGGDTLSSIARIHKMTLRELMEINKLEKTSILKGQKLKVKSIEVDDNIEKKIELFSNNMKIDKEPIIYNSNYYYYREPKSEKQLHQNYFEDPFYNIDMLYKQAAFLMEQLDKKIDKHKKISDKLKNIKIVIDPGHGGLDPGAISKASDNEGEFFIVEDEYCYDIALRIYILLKLHSADVIMTILSPNHLLRDSNNTFVNEKNEVLNQKYLKNSKPILPRGNRESLLKRIEIARNFLGKNKKNTLFVSIHSDNFRYLPQATSILYFSDGKKEDEKSKAETKKMLPYLGAGAHKMGRNLRVLNNNPAEIKYLIEVKNLAYKPHVWDMKQAKLRQKEAEKIVLGIIENMSKK